MVIVIVIVIVVVIVVGSVIVAVVVAAVVVTIVVRVSVFVVCHGYSPPSKIICAIIAFLDFGNIFMPNIRHPLSIRFQRTGTGCIALFLLAIITMR